MPTSINIVGGLGECQGAALVRGRPWPGRLGGAGASAVGGVGDPGGPH